MKKFSRMSFCIVGLAAAALFLGGCDKQEAKAPAAAPTAQAANQGTDVAQLTQQGEVTHEDHGHVGIDESFPPMVFRDAQSKLTGYDIELMREVLIRTGIKESDIAHTPVNWQQKHIELNDKKSVDMLWSGLNISEERKKDFDFTVPYLDNDQVIVVLENSPVNNKADLGGLTVGAQTGSSLLPILRDFQGTNGKIAKIVEYPDYGSILVGLMEGKIDAGVMGGVASYYYLKSTPGKFRQLDETLGHTFMAVAVRKGNTELLNNLNKALESAKADGTIKALNEKWFPGMSFK